MNLKFSLPHHPLYVSKSQSYYHDAEDNQFLVPVGRISAVELTSDKQTLPSTIVAHLFDQEKGSFLSK